MTDTHCPYCSLQCAMRLDRPDAGGGTLPVVSGREFPTNGGGLCRKGWTSAQVLDPARRLTTPLLRGRDGTLEPADWDAAYDAVVAGVRRARRRHGPDGVAVFGGGGLTNEKAYTLGKFARLALGTRYVDYNGRFCMSSAATAGSAALGIDRGLPFPLADLGGAAAILLLGSNPAETMPPAVRHLAGARGAGGLIVVDPRRTATAALSAEGGGLHLAPLPGTDVIVLLGLLHLVLLRGHADEDYLARRTRGADELRVAVALWWPERVERATGVPAADLEHAADLLTAASPSRGGRGAYVLTGRGVEQHAHGTDTVTAAIDLALTLGLPGAPGSGYGCLTGQGNGQGGREHGQKADQLPGYRSITDPAARAHVARVWGVSPEAIPGPGVPAVELLHRLGRPGGPAALFVHGSNLMVSAPRAAAVEERLRSLTLLVVADVVLSETAALADVVVPVTQWAEEEGTMTSVEGRVLRRRRAVDPPPGVRDELAIWADLAARLGAPGSWPVTARETYDELRAASAGGRADYAGITYERLDAGEALYWPCPTPEHPGTPRLFGDGFPTPDGRAVLTPVEPVGVADDVRADAPLYLTTGRALEHYQSGAQTRRVPELAGSLGGCYLQIHPATAATLGIEEGLDVRVDSTRGSFVARAILTDAIRPDVVFSPFHFPGEQRANLATSDAVDPRSGMPEFKACAVRVTPADPSGVGLARRVGVGVP